MFNRGFNLNHKSVPIDKMLFGHKYAFDMRGDQEDIVHIDLKFKEIELLMSRIKN